MSCAELLAVCLLSAERGPAPRRQPLPIFHDVNDGKLSFEEFKNYFSDGILSSEELWELFSGIDRRHSEGNGRGEQREAAALCSWAKRVRIWGARSVHELLLPFLCGLRYESSSKMEQFLTRFLLRETLHQLQSLQASLECAVDTVEEQAGRDRKEIKKSESSAAPRSGRRCGRRGQKNVCLSPTDPYSGMLTTGTCCPSGCLGPAGAWRGCGTSTESLSSHKLNAAPLCFGSLMVRLSAELPVLDRGWPHRARAVPGLCQGCASLPSPSSGSLCPHSVSACKLTDEACFILYEFWQDVTSWRSHLQSSCSKTFQQSILSLLESPELLTTMLFPGEGSLSPTA
ncbi:NECA3 protein, partial [Climacteris rufus]|nr:NECA3 protein [Climacteris rufus]